jgi:hypothetical protein
MPYELYVEVANLTVAAIFAKGDKSKLSKTMTPTAKAALVKLQLTVSKRKPTKTNELHAWRRIDHQGEGYRCEGDGGDSRNARV